SPTQLQRAFTRAFGISPRAYQEQRRMNGLRTRLRAGTTVSRASFETGFGSTSRVYERAESALGMTPGAYRRGGRGERIRFTLVDAPVGRLLVGATARGICAVTLGEDDAALEAALRVEFPEAVVERDDEGLASTVESLVERLERERGELTLRLDVRGTAFQWKVWQALQRIPRGETRTYAEVAASIGMPTGARAVARACASNQVALLIPCHRVVRGDGGMGGYRWGVARKEALLQREKAR
ncbi:MAG TPA: methylated-DNA--[protein]-cysteine S-methyltransferase, partial [Gemmatimonadaceae bacterium]|nr:methylated-DNA--[protein]-cysteine S-methyltransferase [Gemmatimonadaceae bacterium]